MTPRLECVPNFSEGRRPDVIEALVAAIRPHGDVQVLDVSSDADHNRSVVTLAGEPDALIEAMLDAAGVAVASIDLARHEGVHPRIGALDVCPFVPLGDTAMSIAVDTAQRFGERLAREHALPVYLYGEAARRSQRRLLAEVRRGPLTDPDFGGQAAHPTAGATAVGARFFLIAFNVELASTDVQLARSIARRIRERDGGLEAVRALGLRLADRVQVSMNLVDYRVTGVRRAFDSVSRLAEEAGVGVHRSEIVGLVPSAALTPEDGAAVRIPEPAERYWIEDKLADE